MMRDIGAALSKGDLLLVLDGALGMPVVCIASRLDDVAVAIADRSLRASGVMPQIASLLSPHARANVAAVVVGTGPGSYSGIRSAAGAAASIAIALGVSVAPLPSDRAIARAAVSGVDLPLGAREILRIDSDGARLLEPGTSEMRGVKPIRALDEAGKSALVEPLLLALAEMGRAAVRSGAVIDPARAPIELRYLARPRGVTASGSGAQ